MLTQTWWNKSFFPSQWSKYLFMIWETFNRTHQNTLFIALFSLASMHLHHKKNPYYQAVKRFVSSHHDVKNRCKLGKMKSFPLGAKRIAKKLSSPLLFLSCFAERTERARFGSPAESARTKTESVELSIADWKDVGRNFFVKCVKFCLR